MHQKLNVLKHVLTHFLPSITKYFMKKKDQRNKALTEFSAWRHVIDLTSPPMINLVWWLFSNIWFHCRLAVLFFLTAMLLLVYIQQTISKMCVFHLYCQTFALHMTCIGLTECQEVTFGCFLCFVLFFTFPILIWMVQTKQEWRALELAKPPNL